MNKGLTKAILLAGGSGSRWYPTSLACSKHLFPVYDKPMIYYPLSTLIECGVSEILIIGNQSDISAYKSLFGDGSELGLSIDYKIQPKPEGIAQAITIAADFIGQNNFALVLGDNLFSNSSKLREQFFAFQTGAHIFATEVNNPEKFGVVELYSNGQVKSITEKPVNSKSNLAIVGLYLYSSDSIKMVRNLLPSGRGEYEISDLNSAYLTDEKLTSSLISTDDKWFDCGDPEAIMLASEFLKNRSADSIPIGSIEASAYKAGRISLDQLELIVSQMPDSIYRQKLTNWLQFRS